MYSFEIDTEPLEPLPSPDSQSGFTCCWLNMFDGGYVLAQGFPTPPRQYGRGLELPLDIMIEQAMTYNAISHTINGEDCMVLKGRYTALVPVYLDGLDTLDQTSEVQWHLVGKRPGLVAIGKIDESKSEENYRLTDMEFSTTDQELSWEDIDQINEKGLKIFPIKGVQEVSSKRSFVGHFPKAQILVGTDRETYDQLEGGPKAKPVHGSVIKFGQAISLTLGTNAATAGLFNISAGTTIKRSKFDSVPKQTNALITDKLRNDRNKPHILYDISKRIAWMIPEACLVLYLIHYWAVLQSDISPVDDQTDPQQPPRPGQDDHKPQPMGSVKEHMPFIKASSDAAKDAANAILREFINPKRLPKHIRFMEDPERLVYVTDIIIKMYQAIDVLVEHQQRKKPGKIQRLIRRADHDLWGYDLADVAGFDEAPMKSFSISREKCGGWYELTNPDNRIVVLFGNNFGELIKYEADQLICNQWKSVPSKHDFLSAESGTLEYLQKQNDRTGRSNVFLSDKHALASRHGQKQCQEEEWPCCNMAWQLTSKEPELIVKVKRGEAVVIGKAVRGVNQKDIKENIGKCSAAPHEKHPEEGGENPKKLRSQYDFGLPGTCSLCTGDGSSSEKSSPEGAEIDLGAASVASSSNTPQSAWV